MQLSSFLRFSAFVFLLAWSNTNLLAADYTEFKDYQHYAAIKRVIERGREIVKNPKDIKVFSESLTEKKLLVSALFSVLDAPGIWFYDSETEKLSNLNDEVTEVIQNLPADIFDFYVRTYEPAAKLAYSDIEEKWLSGTLNGLDYHRALDDLSKKYVLTPCGKKTLRLLILKCFDRGENDLVNAYLKTYSHVYKKDLESDIKLLYAGAITASDAVERKRYLSQLLLQARGQTIDFPSSQISKDENGKISSREYTTEVLVSAVKNRIENTPFLKVSPKGNLPLWLEKQKRARYSFQPPFLVGLTLQEFSEKNSSVVFSAESFYIIDQQNNWLKNLPLKKITLIKDENIITVEREGNLTYLEAKQKITAKELDNLINAFNFTHLDIHIDAEESEGILKVLLNSKGLKNLISFKANEGKISNEDFIKLISSKNFENIKVLHLVDQYINDSGFADVMKSTVLDKLEELNISKNTIASKTILEILNRYPKLTSIGFGSFQYYDEPAVAISMDPVSLKLKKLNVNHNRLDIVRLTKINENLNFKNLEYLDLTGNSINDNEIAEIAKSDNYANLKELIIYSNQLTQKDAKVIADNTRWKKLETLVLSNTQMDDEALVELSKSDNLVNLKKLIILDGPYGARGVKALINSPKLKNITHLEVNGSWQESEPNLKKELDAFIENKKR